MTSGPVVPPGGTEPGSDLLAWVRATCLDLPDARTDQPFGPGASVFRIHRRLFAIVLERTPVSEHPLLNLKADPHEVPLLRRTHPWLLPAYHMNKKHWVSAELGPGVDLGLLAELVEDSYDAVVARLPVRLRGLQVPRRDGRTGAGTAGPAASSDG